MSQVKAKKIPHNCVRSCRCQEQDGMPDGEKELAEDGEPSVRSLHLLIAAYRLLFKLFSMRLLCVNIIFSIYEPSVWAWEIPPVAGFGFGRQISIGNLGPRNWKSRRYKHEAFVIIMPCPPFLSPRSGQPTPPYSV